MEPIKLSFCIPTWNRAKELKECLDSIIGQIIEGNFPVEILVSDNASTDETLQLLQDYSQKYDFLKFSRNKENVGFDLNLILSIEKARGEYAWLFGDDDILEKGALKYILELIYRHSPDYISTNYYLWEPFGGGRKKLKSQPHSKAMSTVKREIFGVNLEKLLDIRTHWFTFISSNIVRKESIDFLNLPKRLEHLKHWVHLEIISEALLKKNGIISPHFCVGARANNGRSPIEIFNYYLPTTLGYIFERNKLKREIQNKVYKSIFNLIYTPKIFLKSKVTGEKIIIPPLWEPYKGFLIRIILKTKFWRFFPKKIIELLWKIKRFFAKKGFSLPEI